MAADPKRLVGIDVLRAIAIIAVLALHLGQSHLVEPPRSHLVGYLWWATRTGGFYGVILFFAISGFVIARTTIERDGSLSQIRIARFYARRTARIGPALFLHLLLGAALLLTVSPVAPAAKFVFLGTARYSPIFWISVGSFTFNFLLAQTLTGAQYFGWHWNILWTLAVEEQFYLFFPWLLRAAGRSRLWVAISSLILIGIAYRVAIEAGAIAPDWEFATPAWLDVLAIGVATAALPSFSVTRAWALRGAAAGLVLICLGFLTCPWFAKPLAIGLGAALVMLCSKNGAVFTGRLWTPFARIGRVSYGIYLFHPLMLFCLAPVLREMQFLPALVLFVAASTLAAEISFRIVEQPAGRWLRIRLAPRSGRAAAARAGIIAAAARLSGSD